MKIVQVAGENFFSYEAFNLDLLDRGLLLLEGANGAGKSTIFEAIKYGLFGATMRYGRTNSRVSRNQEGGARVYLNLLVQGTKVEIYRHQDHPEYGNKTLLYLDGKDRTMGGNRETQARITNILGMSDTVFQNTVMFAQGSKGIAEKNDADQKAILDEILKMGRFGQALERAKEREKQLDLNLTSVHSSIAEIRRAMAKVEENLIAWNVKQENFEKEKQEGIKIVEKEIEEWVKQEPTVDPKLGDRIFVLNAEINSPDNTRWNSLLEQTQGRLVALSEERNILVGERKAIAKELKELSEDDAIPSQPDQSLEFYKTEVEFLKANLQEKELLKTQLMANVQSRTTTVETISQLERCGECNQPLNDKAREFMSGSSKEEIKNLLAQVSKLEAQVSTDKDKLNEMEDYYYNAKAWEEYEQHELVRVQVQKLDEQIAGLQERESRMEEVLKEAQGHIKDLETKKEDLRKLQELKNDFSTKHKEWELEKKSRERVLEEIRNKVSPYLDQIANAEKAIENSKISLGIKEAIAETISSDLDIVSYWVRGFGNQGVKVFLLEKVLPFLNSRTEEYLDFLTDGRAKARFNTKTKLASGEEREKLSVHVRYVDGSDGYSGTSGGEAARVDIATLLAVGDLAASRSRVQVGLRLLDELFENLDSAGMDAAVRLLEQKVAPRTGTVIVMTHDDRLKARFENVVSVVKENGVSRIVT